MNWLVRERWFLGERWEDLGPQMQVMAVLGLLGVSLWYYDLGLGMFAPLVALGVFWSAGWLLR